MWLASPSTTGWSEPSSVRSESIRGLNDPFAHSGRPLPVPDLQSVTRESRGIIRAPACHEERDRLRAIAGVRVPRSRVPVAHMQNPQHADEQAERTRQVKNREEAEQEREKALHREAAERFEAVGDERHAEDQRDRAEEVDGGSA